MSEDLDEDAVQALVGVALGSLLPELCNEWVSSSQYVRETFMREQWERKGGVARNIADEELQHVLRGEVVNHVISVFPYVLIQSSNTEGVYLMQIAEP